MTQRFTAIIEREDDGFVALCPELDLASQGCSVPEARANLQEAIELFLETAPKDEIQLRSGGTPDACPPCLGQSADCA